MWIATKETQQAINTKTVDIRKQFTYDYTALDIMLSCQCLMTHYLITNNLLQK